MQPGLHLGRARGSSLGTDGGNGSASATLAGDNGDPQCSGTNTAPTSGGGGSAGIIGLYRATSPTGGGGISPAPT